MLEDDGIAAVHIERRPELDQDSAIEVIDLQTERSDGGRGTVTQVKSVHSPERSRPVSGQAMAGVVAELCKAVDADHYEYVTNARIGPSAKPLVAAAPGRDVATVIESLLGRALDSDVKRRLSRLRVRVLDESAFQFRRRLETEVRARRRIIQRGIGEASSYLVLGVLLDRIFELAAGVADGESKISHAEAARLIDLDAQALAGALGARDWGRWRGSAWPEIPTIDRTPIRERMEDLLLNVDASQARRVVLDGMSGIGKSALAAGFAHANRHQFDFIVWLSCQEEYTLLADLRSIAAHLPELASLPDAALPQAFRDYLEATSQSWLLVLDDVRTPAVIRGVLPHSGCGPILATTRDARIMRDWSPITVAGLDRHESLALLGSYLDSARSDRASLSKLCATCGDIPLALRSAGNYVAATGSTIAAGAAEYARQISHLAIDNPAARPIDAPDTLAEAIRLSYHSLADDLQVTSESEPNWPAYVAIRLASYLGPAPIPIVVLHTAAGMLRDAWGTGLDLSREIESALPAQPELDRFVLAARARSLGQLAGPGGEDGPLGQRLMFNSVVQEVLFEETERVNPSLSENVHKIARLAVGSWLCWALENDDASAALGLVPHAEALLAPDRAVATPGPETTTLLGNLAQLYRQRGDHRRQRAALERELTVIEQLAVKRPNLAEVKTLSQLVDALLHDGASTPVVLDALRRAVATVRAFSAAGGSGFGRALVNLDQLAAHLGDEQSVRALAPLLATPAVRSELGWEDQYEQVAAYRRAQDAIVQGNDRDALEICTSELRRDLHTEQRMNFQALAAEACGYLHQPEAMIGWLVQCERLVQAVGLHAEALRLAIANCALACIGTVLFADGAPHAEVLLALSTSWKTEEASMMNRSCAGLEACVAYRSNDRQRAREALARYDSTAGQSFPLVRADMILELVDPIRTWLTLSQ
ncbi:MAG: NB-ARC domain-containing protein [Actinomycetota bacterium]|nr:NB-ARC domain-containing protein [Actinomycetota bacterium]